MNNNKLKHSPLINFPLGEPCHTADGAPAVKYVRRDREEILLVKDYLIDMFGPEIFLELIPNFVSRPSEEAAIQIK